MDINFFNKYFVYIDVPKHYRRARAHSITNDGIFVSIDFVSLVGPVVDLPTSMGITLRSRKRYPGLLIGCMVGVASSIAIAMVRYLVAFKPYQFFKRFQLNSLD